MLGVTIDQAADVLNISREYLEQLLQEGLIPRLGTGADAVVHLDDVLRFKVRRDRERRDGLRDLSRMTQEFGGYDSE